MSSNSPGNREVAHRLFAAEFNDATYSYSESDEERAPNYVVTPTGARINRLFAVGVLTEVTQAGEEILRARVVDPSGAFVVYAGQYQPEAMNFLDRAEPPAFVAVTGKARTFQPEDSAVVYTSVRPESISEVDAATRDRWTVTAAERTLERIGTFDAARETGVVGDALREALSDAGADASLAAGIPIAIEQYDTTRGYLAALQELALDATRQVAGEIDEVGGLDLAPDEGGDAAFTPAMPTSQDLTPAAAGTTATATDADEMASSPESRETEAESEAAGSEAGEAAEPSTADSEGDATDAAPTAAANAAPEPESGSESSAGGESEEPEFDAVEPEDLESTEKGDEEGPGREPAVASGSESAAEELADEDGSGIDETDIREAESPDAGDETDPDAIETGDPEEFELDEETRREVEEEYGTEFSMGSEVASAGEADIETPDPDAAEEVAAADGNGESDEESEEPEFDAVEPEDLESTEKGDEEGPGREPAVASGSESAAEELADEDGSGTDETESDAEDESAEREREDTKGDFDAEDAEKDGDDGAAREPVAADPDAEPAADDETEPAPEIDDVLMDAMRDLDDGDGASRDELVERVAAEADVEADEVDNAIQDALMSGQCYEPEDGRLKPI